MLFSLIASVFWRHLKFCPRARPKGARPASKTYQGRIWSALVAHSYLNWIILWLFLVGMRVDILLSVGAFWHLRGQINLNAEGGIRCQMREAQWGAMRPSTSERLSLRRWRSSAERGNHLPFLITDSMMFAKQLPRCFGISCVQGKSARRSFKMKDQ